MAKVQHLVIGKENLQKPVAVKELTREDYRKEVIQNKVGGLGRKFRRGTR